HRSVKRALPSINGRADRRQDIYGTSPTSAAPPRPTPRATAHAARHGTTSTVPLFDRDPAIAEKRSSYIGRSPAPEPAGAPDTISHSATSESSGARRHHP